MTFGLRVTNTSGGVVCGTDAINYHMVGTVSGVTGVVSSGVSSVAVDIPEGPNLLCYYGNYRGFMLSVNVFNGVRRHFVGLYAPQGTTVNFCYFGLGNPNPAGHGIKVWDAAGNVTYCQDTRPLRMFPPTGTLLQPAGKNYGFILTAPGGRYWQYFTGETIGTANPSHIVTNRTVTRFNKSYDSQTGETTLFVGEALWYTNTTPWQSQLTEFDFDLGASWLPIVDLTGFV